MSAPILTTKLYIPPARTELVSRKRLTEHFDVALTRTPSLTLVSAPPGFGKTTVVSEWIARRGADRGQNAQTAWLSLDEQDNDPVRFWSYVAAALERVQAGVSGQVTSMIQARQAPPIEEGLTVLINTLATVSQPFSLVLDDYHLIEQTPIHHGLTFFLDHLPPQMNLILISRSDPPLPLTRLRVRNQLTELRETELRFTAEEVATFLNQVMQLNLTPEDIRALEGRTEGWIAGLQLAALSMQGRGDVSGFVEAFTGSHRYVIDYLAEEVLAQQPPEIRDFLLRTSIVERLHGPLCDTLLSKEAEEQGSGNKSPISQSPVSEATLPISQSTLEYLDQANLFLIPLDDERRWYRYHHLFADFLRGQLQKKFSAEAIVDLHHQAAEWYLAQNMSAEAVQHALAGGDFEQATDLVERLSMSMLTQGEVVTLLNWLEKFPSAVVRQRPRLSLSFAWANLILNRFDAIEAPLEDAERVLAGQTPESTTTEFRTSIGEMQGEMMAIRSMIMGAQGQVSEAINLAEQALSQVRRDDGVGQSILKMHLGNLYESTGDFERGVAALSEALTIAQNSDNSIIIFSAGSSLADLYMHQGQLHQANQLQQGLRTYFEKQDDSLKQPFLVSRAYLGLAEIAREQNDLTQATRYLDTAFKMIRQSSSLMGSIEVGYVIQARILAAQSQLDQAIEVITAAKRYSTTLFPVDYWVAAVKARLHLAQGDFFAAGQWAEDFPFPLEAPLEYGEYPGEYANLVRVYLAQEQFEAAQTLLAQMQTEEEKLGRQGRLLELLILQALSHYAQGQPDQALPWLEKALPLAEAGGYVRLFVDEGLPMADLLRKVARSNSVSNYVYTLLDAFDPPTSATPAPPTAENRKSKIENLVEPLSERELEVLHLIAAGLSNQEIADQLIIAEGTVKKHIHNIFGKLAVRRRTQVVVRARELGLISHLY